MIKQISFVLSIGLGGVGLADQPKCEAPPCKCHSLVDSYSAQFLPQTTVLVNAYYNGSGTGNPNANACQIPPVQLPEQNIAPKPNSLAAQDGEEYECVEFVRRFYRLAKGVTTSAWYGDAYQFFANASLFGLIPHMNGATSPPRSDDIVGFAATSFNPKGHVAIVKSVDTSSCASESVFKVELIEQNTDTENSVTHNRHELLGTCHLQMNSTYTYQITPRCPKTCSPVQGWLRLPGTPLTATLSNVVSYNGLTATGSFNYDPANNLILASSVVVSGNGQFPSFIATLNDLTDSYIKNMSVCCDNSHNSVPFVSVLLTSSNPQSNAFYVNGALVALNLTQLPMSTGPYPLLSDLLGNDPTNGGASSIIGGSNCGSGVVPCFNNSSVLTSGSLIITSPGIGEIPPE